MRSSNNSNDGSDQSSNFRRSWRPSGPGDGGRAGPGRAIAQTLAAAGAKVACIDVNADWLTETVGAIRAAGGSAEPMACDVTDAGRVGQVVDEVIERFGA